MPMPIRPTNSSDSGFINYFPVNMELMQNELLTNASLNKTALASDRDADVLFYIWKNSSVINNNEEVEKKTYRISNNVKKEDVLKLKASGLIIGGDRDIRFTSRAANIIKTMVLGEQNSFEKQSVKKPYSIILADQKRPKRKSALALASKTIDLENKDLIKIAGSWPDFSNKYYYNDRVISKGINSATSNKEYNVRVYEMKKGEYEVWTFWGKTNGTLQSKQDSQTNILEMAKDRAKKIISSKKFGSSQYKPALEWGQESINESIPGIDATKPSAKDKKTMEELANLLVKKKTKKNKKSPSHKEYTEKEIQEQAEELLEKNIEKGKGKQKNEFFEAEQVKPIKQTKPIKTLKQTLEDLIENPPESLDEISDKALRQQYWEYLNDKESYVVKNQAKIQESFNKQGTVCLENKLLLNIKMAAKKNKSPSLQQGKSKSKPLNNSYLLYDKELRENILRSKHDIPVEDVINAIRNRIVLIKEIPNPSLQLVERLIHEFKGEENKSSIPIPQRTIMNFLNNSNNVSPETLRILAGYRRIYTNKYQNCENPELKSQMMKTLSVLERKLLEKATGNEDWAIEIVISNPPESLNEIKNKILKQKYWEYLNNENDTSNGNVLGGLDSTKPVEMPKTTPNKDIANKPKKTLEDVEKEYLESVEK